MTLDYLKKGQVSIDMSDYVKTMLNDCPATKFKKGKVKTPWNESMFKVKESSPPLEDHLKEQFHKTTYQGLFLSKRGCLDLMPGIAYYTTCVQNPNWDNWAKLRQLMSFLNQTKEDKLTLKADSLNKAVWHTDMAFAVHPDFCSHTGYMMSFGKGIIISGSKKQKMNMKNSTKAELIRADEAVGPILWILLFLKEQGYDLETSILYQDNKSTILLEKNGCSSAGKWSRHLNIRLFFITNQILKGHINVEYCPTEEMTADYLSKPMVGAKFKRFRHDIMNLLMPTTVQIAMWCQYA